MCGRERDQVSRLTKPFVCGTRVLAVDAPGVRGKVGLFLYGPDFHRCTATFPFVHFLLVVAQLENGGSGIHGKFDVEDGELCTLHFILRFFHGDDEVRHACSVFVEEEHVRVQRNYVKGLKASRVLLKVIKEVTCKDFVEECCAILEFVDVHFFHCGANELLAAVLSCLQDFVVFGASFVDGLGLLHLDYCCIFCNLVVPEAKAFGDGKCIAFVVTPAT
jgi:hypothetical protein